MPCNKRELVSERQKGHALGAGQGCSVPLGYIAHQTLFSGAASSTAEAVGQYTIGGALGGAAGAGVTLLACGLFAVKNQLCCFGQRDNDYTELEDAGHDSDSDKSDAPGAASMTHGSD